MSEAKFKVHFSNGTKGKRRLKAGAKPSEPVGTTVPRIARLMALAIHFDQLIRDGVVEDYADLARLGKVSRARISQIMDLTLLSPRIQREIVLSRTRCSERKLREVVKHLEWAEQWDAYTRLSLSKSDSED